MKLQIIRNGTCVAIATIVPTVHKDLEIEYIKVEPEYRGQRLATTLLQRAKKYAINQGKLLVAFVDPDGTGLTLEQENEWFKRHGFKRERYDFGGYTKWTMVFKPN